MSIVRGQLFVGKQRTMDYGRLTIYVAQASSDSQARDPADADGLILNFFLELGGDQTGDIFRRRLILLKILQFVEIFMVEQGHDVAHVFFYDAEVQQNPSAVGMLTGNVDFDLPVMSMQVLAF